MLKDKTFALSFAVLLALATVHHLGIALHFYYTIPSLDLVTHFLGGLWVALIILWLIFRSGYVQMISFSEKNVMLVTLVSILVVGVLWELFELWAGIIIKDGYVLDTALDGAMDVLGALVGFYLFVSIKKTAPPSGGAVGPISLSQ